MAPRRPVQHLPPNRVGAAARAQLIEAAGEIFAAKGLEGATSREICVRAGMNSAAVNYHFGGFDALYRETLIEAHRRAVGIDAHMILEMGKSPAQEKLLGIIRIMLRQVAKPPEQSWEIRLIIRELVAPSAANNHFVETVIGPHRKLIKNLVAEVLSCDPEEPIVGRVLLSIISPGILLALTNNTVVASIDPTMALRGEADVDDLVLQIEQFIFGGLKAMVRLRANKAY